MKEDAPDKFRRAQDDESIVEATWRTLCVVGIAPQAGWLPADLFAAADFRMILPKLDASAACELARRLTDSEPTVQITDSEVEAAGPRTLRLARRPEQSADQYIRKLREILSTDAMSAPATMTKPQPAPANEPRDALTLDRLAGMDEAVAWGMSLRVDLIAFAAGERAWSEVDRGLLVSGPPGCGKTIFAAALARTCGVPLVTGSWSQWMANGSGHQGDFMLAMKRTFSSARASAPCILFLDEVDSFPNRGELTHSHKNRDIQVVNGLLAELDGTEARAGVVVVACNNPHLLDPALVRSGRLDRHIRISMPSRAALAAIMRELLGDDLAGVKLDSAALLASGSSGADIERIVRCARRRARAAARPMVLEDLTAEIGAADERTPDDLRRAAIHESGHAVVAIELGVPIRAMTIRSADGEAVTTRGQGAGVFPTERDLHNELVCHLAGRAAEQVILGEPSCGSGGEPDSDLARATRLAARAVSEFGFDERNGLVWRPVPEPGGYWPVMEPMLAAATRTRLASAFSDSCAIVLRRRSAVGGRRSKNLPSSC